MATLEEEYKKYTGEGYDQVNSMYDAQKQSQLAGLESAYNQNLSNAEASRDALGQQYQTRANDLAVQYERQRRNLNEQAAANGLNTGAGSQMQLALGSNYQRDYGGLRTAQQQAVDTANRGIDQLKASYQSAVQQAVADNDYQRAQALLAEYKNQYQRQLQQAQTLASYGDFSAYMNIPGYSQGQVDNMRNTWIAENPGIAYSTGQISADQYYQMTGKWPAGYTQPGAGSGTGWNGNGSGGGGGGGLGLGNGGGNGTGSTPPGVVVNPDGTVDVSNLAFRMSDAPDHGEALYNQYAAYIAGLPDQQKAELAAAVESSYQKGSLYGQKPQNPGYTAPERADYVPRQARTAADNWLDTFGLRKR